MKDGAKIKSNLSVANAHPNGNRPFKRKDYINKFKLLTKDILDEKESLRFLEDVQNLRNLNKGELYKLNIEVPNINKKNNLYKNTIF